MLLCLPSAHERSLSNTAASGGGGNQNKNFGAKWKQKVAKRLWTEIKDFGLKDAHGEAPTERKEAIETLKWGRRRLIRELKDSFRSHVDVNGKHTFCEGRSGEDFSPWLS